MLATQQQESRDAKAADQKYYLRQTPLIHLPLTEYQATKINAALKNKQPYESWLSGRQLGLLNDILTVVKSEPTALSDWTYPAKSGQLADYWNRLEDHLVALKK